jgi:vacuolar-type H+-ATPase subunit C/Vma6
MIPFVPIIQESEEPFAMFSDLKHKYGDWVLDVLKYDTADNLIHVLEKAIVRPALEKGQELLRRKAEAIRIRHVQDFM